MNYFKKMLVCFVLLFFITINLIGPVYGIVDDNKLNDAIENTAEYVYKNVKDPQVGSVGGEWAIIGLARSGYDVPKEYYVKYYSTVENYVKSLKGNLHDKKFTEYSRIIVALSSIGKDATDVGGYNLLTALGDYDKTIWQGLNGPIWALIALDSKNYAMPENKDAKTQATRDMYIQRILDCQLSDGGWSLFGGTSFEAEGHGISDPDITGMALQALAKYQYRDDVKKATKEAIECMVEKQSIKGGFSSWDQSNLESCVQIVVALGELGISVDDERFAKGEYTLLDNLMTFYEEDNGFLHTLEGNGSNMMATEQGFYGLVAAKRMRDGKNSLYRMSDSLKITGSADVVISGSGLENKNIDIIPMAITLPGRTFDDITGLNAHKNQPAIEALAAREIINGKTESLFKPEDNMSRAEFATIVVKGLGLKPMISDIFTDVSSLDWFAPYVGTANKYGIVNGISDKEFNPFGTITKQEAATMLARASKLCGMDTDVNQGEIRDMLAQFSDYVKISEWSRASLAFCYKQNILDQSELEINPKSLVRRCEIAQMIFNMLGTANLL